MKYIAFQIQLLHLYVHLQHKQLRVLEKAMRSLTFTIEGMSRRISSHVKLLLKLRKIQIRHHVAYKFKFIINENILNFDEIILTNYQKTAIFYLS